MAWVGYFFIMRIAILGFGQEGKSVLKYLKKSPRFKNTTISILDKKLKKNYLKNLDKFDIIFRSPGIPYNLPEIQKAVKKGIEISSSTKLFFNEANNIGCEIIGITGTKGKGTTSTLLYKILKAAEKNARPKQRRRVFLAGNIGKPAIEILPKLKKKSVVILELSSFQLQDLKQSPAIAVILDIFEDHLDSHKNFKEYLEAKSSISKYQKLADKIFYFPDNKYSKLIALKSKGIKISISSKNSNIFNKKDLKIIGEHNCKNAVMAATIAKNIGISDNTIKKIVKNFNGLEHRLEFIRQIKNIKFYNDSASTNPYTAVAAIKAFNEPKILICGGKDKNLNYFPLAKALKRSNTKLVILFGENKHKIAKAILGIKNNELGIMKVKNLKQAIQLAYKTAKSLITNYQLPITIIFSPASASFDMFSNYKERGEKFKEFVKQLK